MKQEEFEISEELRALTELSADAEKQYTRIKGLQGKGKLRTNEELVGTILPLFVEVLAALSQWGHAQEEILEDLATEIEEGGGGDESPFDPEDLQVILDAVLVAVGSMRTLAALDSASDEMRKTAQEKLPEFERVAKLLEELVTEDDDEGEEAEDEEEATDDEDGEESGSNSAETDE